MAEGSRETDRAKRRRKARGWAVVGASVTVSVGITAFAPAAIAGVWVGGAGVYLGYKRSVYKRIFDRADQGSFEEGRAHFEKAREKAEPGTVAYVMAAAQLGYYALREGRHEEAERLFSELLEETTSGALRTYLRAALAAVDVLLGVPQGERRELPEPARATVLLHAVVHAANGAREVLESLSVRPGLWAHLSGINVRHEQRGVALLQAYVQHTAGETPDAARLERARAGFVGEYDYLLPPFDGLGDFIDEQGLYSACLPAATVRMSRG